MSTAAIAKKTAQRNENEPKSQRKTQCQNPQKIQEYPSALTSASKNLSLSEQLHCRSAEVKFFSIFSAKGVVKFGMKFW